VGGSKGVSRDSKGERVGYVQGGCNGKVITEVWISQRGEKGTIVGKEIAIFCAGPKRRYSTRIKGISKELIG